MNKPTLVPIESVITDGKNANRGTDRGREALRHSLETYGAGRSILLDKHSRVIAGNKSLAEAVALGHEGVEIIETDGSHLIAVKRTDLDLDEPAARALAFADNQIAALDLSWDVDAILRANAEGIDLSNLWTGDELEELLNGVAEPTPPSEFAEYNEGIETEYCCPKCSYRWSGKPS